MDILLNNFPAFSAAIAIIVSILSWKNSNKANRIAHEQLELNRKPIKTLSLSTDISNVLPVWFTERMTTDHWTFGLIMDNGYVFIISRIISMTDDAKWLEVELIESDDLSSTIKIPSNLIKITGLRERTTANVQVSKIIGALDLQES